MVDQTSASLLKGETWNITADATNTTSASSQSATVSLWIEPIWFSLFRLVFTSTIAFLGALGNLAVSYVVTKRPEMWTAVNFYIRNLSLTDLGVLLINYPLAVIKERFQNRWPLGELCCRAIYPGIDMTFCVAMWTIACIAIERYRAVTRSTARYKTSLKTARIVILLLWVTAFLINGLPLYLVVEYVEARPGMFYCGFKWPDMSALTGLDSQYAKAFTFATVIFTYLLPLSVIIWTYICIAKTVSHSSNFYFQMLGQFSGGQSSAHRFIEQRLKQNSRVKRLLTPVVLVFALTLLPINTLKIIPYISVKLFYFKYIYLVFNLCTLLVVVNASADPLIYCLVSDNFRHAFKFLIRARQSRYKVRACSSRDKQSAHTGSHRSTADTNVLLRMSNSTNLFSSKVQSSKDSNENSTHL